MSVICLQQEQDTIPKGCYGICSDWVSKYENTFLSHPNGVRWLGFAPVMLSAFLTGW